jgi:type VI secretion system protein ImpE
VDAHALFQAGQLDDAIEALGAALRKDPTDVRRRTFLFELLCFAGQFDRAEKQLDVVARSSREAEMGAWLYRSALHAERTRQDKFLSNGRVQGEPEIPEISGTLNGKPFRSISDADPRVGARLEVFAAGQYTWIPFDHLVAVHMEPPKRLRDLLWAPARVEVGPGFQGIELGEVLLPVLSPLSWQSSDPEIRLGRETDLQEREDGSTVLVGQKMLLVDDEAVPILEVRELVIQTSAESQD